MRIKYKNNNKHLSELITLSQYPLDERYKRNFKMFNLTQMLIYLLRSVKSYDYYNIAQTRT